MPPETRETEESRKSLPWTGLLISGGALLLAVGVIGLVVGARVCGLIGYYVVPSDGMAPAIPKHSHVLVERFSYLFGTPQRGDIVAYDVELPPQPKEKFLKRIVGMPGDVLERKSECIFINGKAPREYLPVLGRFDRVPDSLHAEYLTFIKNRLVLPPEQYFVLGDNVGNSLDSLFLGPVTKAAITGKVLFIFP